MGLQFLFMDDNAPCHRTVAAEQLLESELIERMDWPARSPDLNPIEHVWDFLGRRLAARTLPPVTIQELRLALQDEWAAMPQQLIDTLILGMGRRCETCLARTGIGGEREDDIEELIMGHEDEMTIEELQEILNEEHQETQRNVSPPEQEEDERGPMPTSAIKDLLKKWADVRTMALEWHPNQADVNRVGDLYNDNAINYFRKILKKREKQSTMDMLFNAP
ncbi:uncharacterized protein TNCV_2959121 [Trichonephila clavipes]|nr:uncharacterized protein TNCV_2959121 [Trichonephila clavipes]